MVADLSYDELRRIHRLEKNTPQLVEVDEDFFDSLAAFIQREKKEYLASLKNLSSSRVRSFANLKKIVEEVFALREKKLLNRALVASRSGEENYERMTLQEKKTFKELLAVLNKHRIFLQRVFEPERKTTAKSVSLKIIKDVPAFVGPDMKEYGAFSSGEMVSVPPKVAELLLVRKFAERQD